MTRILALASCGLLLGGCSWFGGKSETAENPAEPSKPAATTTAAKEAPKTEPAKTSTTSAAQPAPKNIVPPPGPRVVAAASTAEQAALIDQVKSLEGEWNMIDENGKEQPGLVFKVSSSGSVVREIMFPGSDHEMTNIYHMDGGTLIMTHYCAEGNQPRLRARPGSVANRIEFKLDSVTNLTAPDQSYMGEMTLVLVDSDTLRQEWKSLKSGAVEDSFAFELKRKK